MPVDFASTALSVATAAPLSPTSPFGVAGYAPPEVSPWMPFWHLLTRLGEAQVLLPLAALAAIGLWACPQQRPVVRRWLLGFVAAFVLTTVSKIAFMGWGMGIAAWDFTGFSGHAMSAASVLPLLAWLGLQACRSPGLRAAGLGAAVGLAAVIAYSRLPVGAHSASEAVLGFGLGVAASLYALQGARPSISDAASGRVLRRSAALAVVMLGVLSAAPWVSPPTRTHQWVTALSLKLSGRPHPYTRHQLHHRAAMPEPMAMARPA
ncbi:phosphatase PAP2 family protein [Roseateles amylovorans]|uniref:Phosphatidic acid phosphatase type 2/haloperoxidase domain-containing protein n=1 Tax=Roseateles amylovorans TaxID=2978473 RepID=A0ABY6B3D2_9BURK|nr:phosphatase PAP2 family protein [Roseateles amylovorans]UXH78484.1 hypothetical protein N4261_00650 [Roseateles amylovorans]